MYNPTVDQSMLLFDLRSPKHLKIAFLAKNAGTE